MKGNPLFYPRHHPIKEHSGYGVSFTTFFFNLILILCQFCQWKVGHETQTKEEPEGKVSSMEEEMDGEKEMDMVHMYIEIVI